MSITRVRSLEENFIEPIKFRLQAEKTLNHNSAKDLYLNNYKFKHSKYPEQQQQLGHMYSVKGRGPCELGSSWPKKITWTDKDSTRSYSPLKIFYHHSSHIKWQTASPHPTPLDKNWQLLFGNLHVCPPSSYIISTHILTINTKWDSLLVYRSISLSVHYYS